MQNMGTVPNHGLGWPRSRGAGRQARLGLPRYYSFEWLRNLRGACFVAGPPGGENRLSASFDKHDLGGWAKSMPPGANRRPSTARTKGLSPAPPLPVLPAVLLYDARRHAGRNRRAGTALGNRFSTRSRATSQDLSRPPDHREVVRPGVPSSMWASVYGRPVLQPASPSIDFCLSR